MAKCGLLLGMVFSFVHCQSSTLSDPAAAPSDPLGSAAPASIAGQTACLKDSDCPSGNYCAQIEGDSYCALDCSINACPGELVCADENTQADQIVSVCVSTAVAAEDPLATSCTAYDPPDTASCCKTCTPGASGCQENGCSGDKDCHNTTCRCVNVPKGCASGTSGGSSAGSSGGSTSGGTTGGSTGGSTTGSTAGGTTGTTTGGTTGGSGVGPTGGTLDNLTFAIAGDTRPPNPGDTAGYPTSIITTIYKAIQNENPRPAFVVSTGDHAYDDNASDGVAFGAQLDLYLAARANYTGTVFFTMGNHECTGYTDSNCGTGNADGITGSFTQFQQKLLSTIGQTNPYYSINLSATDGSWTAKLVFIAANYWSTTQQTWLKTTLAQPTTYTFVMRHEAASATTAPGVSPSTTLLKQYPVTALIVGHTHTLQSVTASKEIIVGNGGAPLTGNIDYGYVVAARRASDGAIVFTGYDYQSHATLLTVAYTATGTLTQ